MALNKRRSWEIPYYPSYYFDSTDLPERFLRNPKQGDASTTYDIVVGERVAEAAVTVRNDGNFRDLVKITFDKMDAWLEEDEEIYFHPRDPYKVGISCSNVVVRANEISLFVQRIDIRQSSRHVRIEVGGRELANTTKPRLLFETGLPVRTYIPKADVRLEHLSRSPKTTGCPYKVLSLLHVNEETTRRRT
jgi:hypothetical protein